MGKIPDVIAYTHYPESDITEQLNFYKKIRDLGYFKDKKFKEDLATAYALRLEKIKNIT